MFFLSTFGRLNCLHEKLLTPTTPASIEKTMASKMDSVVVDIAGQDIAPSGKEADSEEVNLQKFKKLLDEQASKTAFDLDEANFNKVLFLFFHAFN